MRRVFVLLVIFSFGCATTKAAAPVISMDRQWELEELPPDPATDELSKKFPGGDWIEQLEIGDCVDDNSQIVTAPCPERAGMLLSEEKAARAKLYKTRYIELRRIALSDRKIAAAQREYYEARLELARKEIERLQPTWWDENGGLLIGFGGFVLGAVLTVCIAAAEENVTK